MHLYEDDKWNHTGAILAGGRSARMGKPKESIVLWDSRSMIEHVINNLKEICKKVVIVGKCESYTPKKEDNIEIIYDNIPGKGPLSGLEALLASGIDTEYLVISCDQPLVTSDILVLLTRDRTITPRFFLTAEKFTPFPGIYPQSWLPKIRQAIENEKLSLCKLVENSEIFCIMLTKSQCLQSINNPHDLRNLQKLQEKKCVAL